MYEEHQIYNCRPFISIFLHGCKDALASRDVLEIRFYALSVNVFKLHIIGSQGVIEASSDESDKIPMGNLSVFPKYVNGIPYHFFLACLNCERIA